MSENISFSLISTVQDALTAHAKPVLLKGLGLRLNLDENLPPEVTGDPGALRAVLDRLLDNAAVHTRLGEVEVSAGMEESGIFPALEGIRVRFSVRDTGPGLPEGLLPDLCARGGAGLREAGRLVAERGGSIWAANNPDRGCTVSFILPFGLPGPVRG